MTFQGVSQPHILLRPENGDVAVDYGIGRASR